MFTYSGWNSLCYVTEEIEDYTSIPLATVCSVILVTVSYLIINVAYFLGERALSFWSNKINLLFRQKAVIKHNGKWFSAIHRLNPTSTMRPFFLYLKTRFTNHVLKSYSALKLSYTPSGKLFNLAA